MSLESENQELRKENEQLHTEIAENEADFKLLVTSLVSVMSAVGLSPKTLMSDESPMSTIIHAVPSLMTDLTLYPAIVEAKFAPLKALAPLLKKHEQLIESI